MTQQETQRQKAERVANAWPKYEADLFRSIGADVDELPKLAADATKCLCRRAERFKGEHRIALTVLSKDIPRKLRRLRLLEQIATDADIRLRAKVVFGTPAQRDDVVSAVLRDGGFPDDDGGFTRIDEEL